MRQGSGNTLATTSSGGASGSGAGLDARVVKLYTAFQFFFNLLVWVPIFYEFQKRAGLSDPQIFGIQSIYYLTFCLFEVPTGWFADRFGYRTSMRWGAAVLVFANVLPPLAPTYTGFLWHFLLVGLARSLISGAASAWMYEYAADCGAAPEYKKVEGDARFYALIGKVAAWAAIGWMIARVEYSPYWLSALNAGIALGVAFLLPRVNAEAGGGHAGLKRATEKRAGPARALQVVAAEPSLLLLMLQGIGLFVLVRIMQVNLYQPLLTARSFDISAFGWVMSVMTIFEAVGSKLAPRVKRVASDLTTVTIATGILSVAVLLMAAPALASVSNGGGARALTLAAFSLFSLAAGLAYPVQRQVLNDAIHDSSVRATLLSMESIIDRAVCALCVLPLGGLVARGVLAPTLAVSGAATLIFAGIVHTGVRVARRRRQRTPLPHFREAEISV